MFGEMRLTRKDTIIDIPSPPPGFLCGAAHCGLKRNQAKPDVAVFLCPTGAVAAGMYTTNSVRAACVDFNRGRTPAEGVGGVVVNSGNANACTGRQGVTDNARMAEILGEAVGFDPSHALTLSTGVIGERLPMDKLERGIRDAVQAAGADAAHLEAAARGMMTTDRTLKVASQTAETSQGPVQLVGVAKGAGMIGPRMATMLAVIMTDARFSAATAQSLLQSAVAKSFNCISVEGHMSTNDSAILLASGHGPAIATAADTAAIAKTLDETCLALARMIPSDGEGATHLIAVKVTGAPSDADADRVARTVAGSALVKTAVAGADPNWGRIVSAAGYAGVTFDPAAVRLSINGATVFEQGAPVAFDALATSQSIRDHFETIIELSLGSGAGAANHFASDLTAEYVHINADYHT